jgi:hypothetical protein
VSGYEPFEQESLEQQKSVRTKIVLNCVVRCIEQGDDRVADADDVRVDEDVEDLFDLTHCSER